MGMTTTSVLLLPPLLRLPRRRRGRNRLVGPQFHAGIPYHEHENREADIQDVNMHAPVLQPAQLRKRPTDRVEHRAINQLFREIPRLRFQPGRLRKQTAGRTSVSASGTSQEETPRPAVKTTTPYIECAAWAANTRSPKCRTKSLRDAAAARADAASAATISSKAQEIQATYCKGSIASAVISPAASAG